MMKEVIQNEDTKLSLVRQCKLLKLDLAASCAPSDGHYGIAGRIPARSHPQNRI
jgi:hypothetical protein